MTVSDVLSVLWSVVSVFPWWCWFLLPLFFLVAIVPKDWGLSVGADDDETLENP
jgi:hypothetical protein